MGKISEMLTRYKNLNRISFSMPGHKNGRGIKGDFGKFDVTELSDTDSLHHSEGAVREACEKISELINDRIKPIPRYEIEVISEDDKDFINRLKSGDYSLITK